jgi:hypothetical protein
VRVDPAFFVTARQALLPLPLVDRAPGATPAALPPFQARPDLKLAGRHVVGADGSGASVAMIGAARAFEEASAAPERISACSASALWGAMWAAGTNADEMAAQALAWRPEAYLGVQWTGLPRFALAALRGFSGLDRRDALEQLFDRRTWRMSAGHTEIPFRVLAYELERRRFEFLGSDATPELTLGELARVAVAPPRKSEAVRIEGRFYVDARAADGFDPARLREGDVFDCGAGAPDFYSVFLDRRRWPEQIRSGHEDATRRRRSASPS